MFILMVALELGWENGPSNSVMDVDLFIFSSNCLFKVTMKSKLQLQVLLGNKSQYGKKDDGNFCFMPTLNA